MSQPYYEAIDGNTNALKVADPTPDEGMRISPFTSGRRILPDNVPTRAVRKGGSLKTFPALEFDRFHSLPFVSDRLRDMIEELEPGVHQFFPVEVRIGKDNLVQRSILNVCKRLDTLDPVRTFPRNERGFYTGVTGEPCAIVHRAEAVAGHHLWHEKFAPGLFASDELVSRIVDAGISGFHISHRHDAA